MAYFNHAFRKTFLGNSKNPSADLDQGYLTLGNVKSVDLLGSYGVGVFGLFGTEANTDGSLISQGSGHNALLTAGKPLTLVSTSVFQNDKIGPFIGGYQETTKSKLINPKYVSKFYRVDPCLPNPNVIHVGNTPWVESSASPAPDCCKDFICGKSYSLRVDVKGSPVLRFLTRNAYWTTTAYTGCCPGDECTDPAPCTIVDPTTVFIQWATGLLGQGAVGSPNFIPNKIVGPFLDIVVYDFLGKAWYQPGTNGGVDEWDTYSPASAWDPDTYSCNASPSLSGGAGMKVTGAYVDTKFGDCTFYPSDFFEKEPVTIFASEVDLKGDVCTFGAVCVTTQCCARQGMGYGEQVLRDFILDQSYMQNYFNTNLDLRIREVTQGYDISSAVDRNAMYYRYYLLHSVPRFNNPSGIFDNDQYLLEVVTNAVSATFESDMATWLTACTCGVELETQSCIDPGCPCTDAPVFDDSLFVLSLAGGASGAATLISSDLGTNAKVTVSSGSLPPGVTLDASTGDLTGTLDTPSVDTAYQFCIKVTNDETCSETQCYTWIVTS